MEQQAIVNSYSIKEEIAHSITHGIGALLSVIGLATLVVNSSRYGDAWHIVSTSIYGVTLIALYTASTLYHAVTIPDIKQVLRKLAKYIEEAIGPDDTVTRLGTCCFAVVPESIGNVTIKQTAAKIIERVRHTRFSYNDEKLRFTVSIGLGAPSGNLVEKFEDVVELVGQRMLVASAAGGNRIVS